ncbi:MAG: hypothetical protein HYZ39_16315 [Mycolicibacterium cosmeticum]|nr:hypothetical protein [Mycolicibacterium cosmeticum]
MVLGWSRQELSAAQKNVLLTLETYANYDDGTNAHPGEKKLAESTGGLTERAVREALKRGRELGLIVRTADENPKAHLAAVYRLSMPSESGFTTGTAVPVNNSTTGTAVPVDNPTAGIPVPVETPTTGTATHHHRNGHVATTGTAVPPTLPAPSLHQPVESDRGTSPGQLLAISHTDRIPSEFCDLHPHGYRGKCGDCGNARTFKRAWLAQKAAEDVAIANAEDYGRAQRRKLIEACQAAGGPCDDFGRVDYIDDDGVHRVRPCDHPNVSGVEHAS